MTEHLVDRKELVLQLASDMSRDLRGCVFLAREVGCTEAEITEALKGIQVT